MQLAAGVTADATGKVKAGEADCLMKGLLDSSVYIRGIIDKEKGLLPPGKLLSHVTVIQAPAWKKLIICGDVAVIPAPDLEAKIAILNYAIDVAPIVLRRCVSCHSQVMGGSHIEVTYDACFLCHFKGQGAGRDPKPIGGCPGKS